MAWYEFALVQAAVLLVMYLIFSKQKKKDSSRPRKTPYFEDECELNELKRLRSRTLSEPLSEMTRPQKLTDIVGQDDAIKALRAALCGKNPQHILIYGPPGVGKTCAARLLLEEAKKNADSPFDEKSAFVEIDATCIRFDERAIADPLLGCVHDPIYQGAGALGVQGIPQPKPGAVTHAHCGVLFLDEIGELHPMQMNKLLKVLEDRRVFFESSYYSKTNKNIPLYIHDIFKNGLPADFRLIGATTRSPEELPSALRSRCVEIYFSSLSDESLIKIAERAAKTAGAHAGRETLKLCAEYANNGRDCVNIIQLASGVGKSSHEIMPCDIEWVASTCRYTRKYSYIMPADFPAGTAFGLGVARDTGVVLEIECTARRIQNGREGTLSVNGAVCEEELSVYGKTLRRKSLALASAENVLCAVASVFKIDCRDYDIAFNIPGGLPVDGPSAGVALCTALLSALTKKPFAPFIALTGEVTQKGEVRAVGGIREKLKAAEYSGAKRVIVPKANLTDTKDAEIEVIGIDSIRELVGLCAQFKERPRAVCEKNVVSAASHDNGSAF